MIVCTECNYRGVGKDGDYCPNCNAAPCTCTHCQAKRGKIMVTQADIDSKMKQVLALLEEMKAMKERSDLERQEHYRANPKGPYLGYLEWGIASPFPGASENNPGFLSYETGDYEGRYEDTPGFYWRSSSGCSF